MKQGKTYEAVAVILKEQSVYEAVAVISKEQSECWKTSIIQYVPYLHTHGALQIAGWL